VKKEGKGNRRGEQIRGKGRERNGLRAVGGPGGKTERRGKKKRGRRGKIGKRREREGRLKKQRPRKKVEV